MVSLSLLPYIVLVAIVISEIFLPRDPDSASDAKRWFVNAILYVFNLFGMRAFFFLFAAIGISIFGSASRESDFPVAFVTIIFSLLLFDFVGYFTHRLYHSIPALWKIHQIHHSDTRLDFSTAVRFHPLEVLISSSVDTLLIVGFNIPAYALAVHGGLAFFFGVVAHSNTTLFNPVDHLVRTIFVTPNMHRVHHSTNPEHYNNNFGIILSFWDRLFSSYRVLSYKVLSGLAYGVSDQKGANELNLWQLLLLPFKSKI